MAPYWLPIGLDEVPFRYQREACTGGTFSKSWQNVRKGSGVYTPVHPSAELRNPDMFASVKHFLFLCGILGSISYFLRHLYDHIFLKNMCTFLKTCPKYLLHVAIYIYTCTYNHPMLASWPQVDLQRLNDGCCSHNIRINSCSFA